MREREVTERERERERERGQEDIDKEGGEWVRDCNHRMNCQKDHLKEIV